MANSLSDRLPPWVFWSLFVLIATSSVGSAVGLYLLNRSPASPPTAPVTLHD